MRKDIIKNRIIGSEIEYGVGPANFLENNRRRYNFFRKAAAASKTNLELQVPEDLDLFLKNQARLYVDGFHLEYATPECFKDDILLFEKAGDYLMEMTSKAMQKSRPEIDTVQFFKNNLDINGRTWGHHLNFQVSPEIITKTELNIFSAFLASSVIWSGGGIVIPSQPYRKNCKFHLSQRSRSMDFDSEWGDVRSIINFRDWHVQRKKSWRLHICSQDSHMSEFVIWLEAAVASLVLTMIEAEFLDPKKFLMPKNNDNNQPYARALNLFSGDPTFKAGVRMGDYKCIGAADIQLLFCEKSRKFLEKYQEYKEEFSKVIEAWQFILDQFKYPEPSKKLVRFCDWATKYELIENDMKRRGYNWDSPAEKQISESGGRPVSVFNRLKSIDIKYHMLCHEKGLYYQLKNKGVVESLLDGKQIKKAVFETPLTRARWRADILKRLSKKQDIIENVTVGWGSISFDLYVPGEDEFIVFENQDPAKTDAKKEISKISRILKRVQ